MPCTIPSPRNQWGDVPGARVGSVAHVQADELGREGALHLERGGVDLLRPPARTRPGATTATSGSKGTVVGGASDAWSLPELQPSSGASPALAAPAIASRSTSRRCSCSQGPTIGLDPTHRASSSYGARVSLYDVLGVDASASATQLHAAYRARARHLHPDRWAQGTTPERLAAEASMQELNAAWAVLSDPVQREEYDRGGTAAGDAEH